MTLKCYKNGALCPQRRLNANIPFGNLPKGLFQSPQIPCCDIIAQQLSHRTPSMLARSEACGLASAYWDQSQ